MDIEIEAKWLNIDHAEMRKKLERCGTGTTLIHNERLMIRRNFDFEDKRLQKVGGWVRVRSEGKKVTLSYKQLNDRSLNGTKEVSVVVDDFEKTCSLLEALGMRSKSYQETKRESWKLGNVEIELDTWPWIPPFIEIEAPTEKELRAAASRLGLDYSLALHGSVETAYQAVYDVTEDEIDSWQEIIFSEIPDWLEKKRIVN